MFAMGGAEGVVAVNIAEFGEGFGEVGIVLFFFLVEAEIFQEENFAILERIGGLFGGKADGVVGEFDGLVQKLAKAIGDGFERIFRFGQVRHEDQAAAALDDTFDRWQSLSDSTIIGDPAVFDGDVEVHAHEDPFGFDVDVGDGFFGHVKLRCGF